MEGDPNKGSPDKLEDNMDTTEAVVTPQPPLSFKERLLGIRRRRATRTFQIEQGDVIMEKVPMGGKLKFSDRLKALFKEDWEHLVVVSLVGETLTYRGLSNAVKRMWCPNGDFEILDFTNGFFGVLLPFEEDEEKALREGPWFVGPHCLSVQKWMPGFRGSTAKIPTVVTWIRLPDLPVEYYHEITLFLIGNFVGKKTLKIDEKTLNANRGHSSATYTVEQRQHSPAAQSGSCPGAQGNGESKGVVENQGRGNSNMSATEEGGPVGLGPWMIAQKRREKFGRQSESQMEQVVQQGRHGAPGGSRFNVLTTEPKRDVEGFSMVQNHRNTNEFSFVSPHNYENQAGPGPKSQKAQKPGERNGKGKGMAQAPKDEPTKSIVPSKLTEPNKSSTEASSGFVLGLTVGMKTNGIKQRGKSVKTSNKQIEGDSSEKRDRFVYPILGWDSEYSIPTEGGKRSRLTPKSKKGVVRPESSDIMTEPGRISVQEPSKPPDPQRIAEAEAPQGAFMMIDLMHELVEPPDPAQQGRFEAVQGANLSDVEGMGPQEGN
ncbi:OLC1v1034296C1 [Oldenlandia corymbosa var. corymbosa]|uniref:OLC1v1034296C1 n=1 Tax=Oldenlandia corymbosa var. corymbosa TaxID=529605 RepID=A0AAV1CRX7_OLDCO|nr:OLC1v1034296C1 [Oldenlandia corymbosa var. corymbosa]